MKAIFEISWEVGNKVGGIYTVLSTKTKFLKNFYPQNYFVIGPYLGPQSQTEFRFLRIPREFEKIIDNLSQKGIIVHYGEWLIESTPLGFLIEFQKFLNEIDLIKHELWEKFGIDSLRTGKDYNEPLSWSKAVSEFIKELVNQDFKDSVFHFHEWLSGSTILFIKDLNLKTIFTTHATVLGRSLSNVGINFWEETIEPTKIAYNFFVEAKHQIEKKSAKLATFFTTISNVTALEAEKFLERKVDYILPNGIDLSRFPTFEEISFFHKKNKSRVFEFILYFFSPYLKNYCPIKNSLIFFMSGRKEIRNKGFDIAIEALGNLNRILKNKKIDKNIYFFIFVPDNFIDVDHYVLENLKTYQSLEDYLENIQDEIISRLLHQLIHQNSNLEDILNKEEFLEIQKILKKIKIKTEIPRSSHLLYPNNELLNLLNKASLNNFEEDKIKVIIYPIYLSSTDGFLNLNYYDVINASHLGIFPSLYEPWGYTPLETLAAGVMSITTDLTGFASYIKEKNLLNKTAPGLFIVSRKEKSDKETIENLTEILLEVTLMSRSERIQNKYEARKLANNFNWQKLIKNYVNIYQKLLVNEN